MKTTEPHNGSGWRVNFYPEALEASGFFQGSLPPKGGLNFAPNPESTRSKIEGARRAKSKLRRYCAANRLNRLGTLTYAGEGQHDQFQFRQHIAEFFKNLKSEVGKEFPYVWVPEWHKSGHGLHAHFAVGRYIKKTLIDDAWNRGHTHIKLLSDLPVGYGAIEEARMAANYLGKYVSKSFEDENRIPGLHRYDLAQGFKPKVQS